MNNLNKNLSETINLACSADNNFAQHLAVTLCSCLYNFSKKNKLEVYILDGGINEINKSKISKVFKNYKNAKLNFINVGSQKYKNYKVSKYMTEIVYSRIDLPTILPNVNKIIYLDSDIVILDDLSEIWNLSMNGKEISAVQDHDKTMHEEYDRFFEFSSNLGYFNTGVMVMNLDLMRRRKSSEKIFSFIEKRGQSISGYNQVAFNFVFIDKWNKILAKWNYNSGLDVVKDFKETAFLENDFYDAKKNHKLIHYASPFAKPWLYESVIKNKKYYYFYLDKTPFRGWRPKISFKSFFKKIAFYIYFIILPTGAQKFVYGNLKFLRNKF